MRESDRVTVCVCTITHKMITEPNSIILELLSVIPGFNQALLSTEGASCNASPFGLEPKGPCPQTAS